MELTAALAGGVLESRAAGGMLDSEGRLRAARLYPRPQLKRVSLGGAGPHALFGTKQLPEVAGREDREGCGGAEHEQVAIPCH